MWQGRGQNFVYTNFCYYYRHPLVYPQFHTILEFGLVPAADELGIEILGEKKNILFIVDKVFTLIKVFHTPFYVSFSYSLNESCSLTYREH
jgi:hypothetical protein